MNKYIAILGTIAESDLAIIRWGAELRNITVKQFTRIPEPGFFSEDNLPVAFLSCFKCEKKKIIELFGQLPVGTGERIPLFQAISKESIDSFLIDLPVQGFFNLPLSQAAICTVIQSVVRNELLVSQNRHLTDEIGKCRYQKNQLVKIGTALTKEYDLNNLLQIILTICREMVNADAGSIYVRERVTPGGAYSSFLTFKVTQNDSVDVGSFNEFRLPIDDNSIAGYVAKTSKLLNIYDVDHIDSSVPCQFDRGWEKKIGYRTATMLTLPLTNIEGEVVGVIQLINKKKNQVIQAAGDDDKNEPCFFTLSDEEYVQSIASQAAVSIERAHYHECIESLFEGFLSSSIAAIDERDKVTSGHSKRVMGYATAFIDAVRNDAQKRFASLIESAEKVRQFQFAALLHDIGKIGVPEAVLTKETRLDTGEWNLIEMRFNYIKLQMKNNPNSTDWNSINDLEEDLDFLRLVNKAGFCGDSMYARLMELKKKRWVFGSSDSLALFTDLEWEKLSVRKGNLTEKERASIDFHAVSTYRILSKIPWTKALEKIPEIAAQHHERLDGSGYPSGLRSDQIILESKILSVIDIFEALVALDRPYKPSLTVNRALDIIRCEADSGLLDSEVVEFFIEKKIYETYMMKSEIGN